MSGLTGARDIYEKEKIKRAMMIAALYSARIHSWNFPTGFLEIQGTANSSLAIFSCDGLSMCLADLELQQLLRITFQVFQSPQVEHRNLHCANPPPMTPIHAKI